ncbi:hypothetical protein J7E88_11385 [Streptomyces sp. ISL-10]|nr:hypothetical protein [Streptomyces sp. ISL-10]MBT2365891.1 hypothetical protein [Streptomyces sp. ISL-10]
MSAGYVAAFAGRDEFPNAAHEPVVVICRRTFTPGPQHGARFSGRR